MKKKLWIRIAAVALMSGGIWIAGAAGMGLVAIFAITHPGATTVPDSGSSGVNGKPGTFIITHYTPCTPNYPKSCDASMEGDASTASGALATYDPSSPMGYDVGYKKKHYKYAVAVSYKRKPVLDFVSPGKNPKRGVVFDDPDGSFIAFDHFGGDAKSNALDIMASDEKYEKFFDNLKRKKLVIGEENNGISSSPAPVVKGTLVDILGALPK